jgi:hypothetical protein
MRKFLKLCFLLFGFLLLQSSLHSQSVNLKSLQDVQLLNVQNCAVVQVNASWNYQNRVRIEQLDKLCYIAQVDIENKDIGAIMVKEWNIDIVPTIIVLKNGVEVKRFVPDISMRFDEKTIIEDIRQEVR